MSALRTAVVLAHGDPPSPELLRRRVAEADWFVCTDGAVRAAVAAGVLPQTVLGDMDSVPPELPPGVECLPILEQETTDLEKCFYTALARGMQRVVVLGAGGGRWDHFFGNLSIFSRYADRLGIEAEDEHGRLWLIPPGRPHPVDLPAGSKVSLLPLPEAVGVTIEGFRWPLTDAHLALGGRDGISNEIETPPAVVTYREGCLGVYAVAGGGR